MYTMCALLLILSLIFFIIGIVFVFVEKKYYAVNSNTSMMRSVSNSEKEDNDNYSEPVIVESVGIDSDIDIFSD